MRILCSKCGKTAEFINGEDGSFYTNGEGWYQVVEDMTITANHYKIFFTCDTCGEKIWIFKD